jgi:hypothetical protein
VKPKAGRASIFRGKADGVRVQGILTKRGARAFEQTRRSLAKLYQQVTGSKPAAVSDADVIEYLAIGEGATVEDLQRR